MSESTGPDAASVGASPGPGPSTEPSVRSSPATNATSGGASTDSGEKPAASPPWSGTLSNLVIGTVDSVKAKATVKVVTGLRAVVYGLVILAAVVTAAFLLLIGLVRMWDVYVPLSPVARRVWLGYVVLGGLLFVAGSWLLVSSRRAKSK